MKKTVITLITLALATVLLVSCSSAGTDISGATDLSGLAGARIAAQSGTFHAEALSQINDVKSSTYPEFSDLLTALKSNAIDGYVAEEPTALTVCIEDPTLDYIHLVNNSTGFTATDRQVGIAIAVAKGSSLRDRISEVLAGIPEETRYALMLQMADLSAGRDIGEIVLKSEAPDNPEGTLRIAMECAYPPFNWTELTSSSSHGSVPIHTEGGKVVPGQFANGYDVQVAQYIANTLGMKLEVYAFGWDSLIAAVQAGTVDAIVAGMSPIPEREKEVDFTAMYYTSNLVIIYKKK